MGQIYFLFGLTYPFARCTFGDSLAVEWVSSWLSRTRVADVNSLITTLNILAVKTLLILHLRAIRNKNFIGEMARSMCQRTRYTDFWFLVTLILYFATAGMFCRIWFLIDKEDWWSKLAEVLVGFKDSAILEPPTDRIFQTVMAATILSVYLNSVYGVPVPLHGCWTNPTHLDNLYNRAASAFEYVF